jgi:hypothetical protein
LIDVPVVGGVCVVVVSLIVVVERDRSAMAFTDIIKAIIVVIWVVLFL